MQPNAERHVKSPKKMKRLFHSYQEEMLRSGDIVLGHIGKRKPAGWLAACALLALLASGCGTDLAEKLQSGKVLPWDGLQGRWVGSVTPVDTSCGPTTRGVLTIGGSDFGFDPFQSTTVIQGPIDSDGHLRGSFVRQAANHQPISISFIAMASSAETITGDLVSGRCRWLVTLHRG